MSRAALAHPLNLLLLISGAVSAAWVGDWRPLAVAAAAEVVWLVVDGFTQSRARRARRVAAVDASEQTVVRKLDEGTRRRFLELDRLRTHLRRLAGANPALRDADVDRELAKVDGLVAGWLRIAAARADHLALLGDDGEASVAPMTEELDRVEAALFSVRDSVASLARPEDLSERLDALRQGMTAVEATVREVRDLDAGLARARAGTAQTAQKQG